MRAQLAGGAAEVARATGALHLLERRACRNAGLLAALTYHRIGQPESEPGLEPGLVSAGAAAFAEQMAYLDARCRPVALADLLAAVREGRVLPPRAVLVTFDDAYVDFEHTAWPILRRFGIPATLFVPTAYPDHPDRVFWWDRLHHALASGPARSDVATPAGRLDLSSPESRRRAYRRLRDGVKRLPHAAGMALVDELCGSLSAPPPVHRVLGWDALRWLARQGVTLASHSRSHPLLHRVPLEQAREEVRGSLADLRREIGDAPPVLAYPAGGFDAAVVSMLEREGFALAFTTLRGVNDLRRAHPLRLRRVPIGRRTTLPLLRAQMLPLATRLARLFERPHV